MAVSKCIQCATRAIMTHVNGGIPVRLQMEEARSYLIQALRKPGWNQVTSLTMNVGNLKAKAQGLDRNQQFRTDGRSYLESGETSLINELIWSFIIQGITCHFLSVLIRSHASLPQLSYYR